MESLFYAVLVGRGDEELEVGVRGEGEQLVAPLGVDAVKGFVEEE